MANLIGQFFGNAADQSADQTYAFSSMASLAACAQVYLTAILASTTPELRSILSEMLSQKIMEHDVISNYMMDKGWLNPYDEPNIQLESCYKQSQSVMSQH